jgi:hypothetical protein
MLLFEREKFFEFVQAGLRAGFEFNAPAPALHRSRLLLAQARQTWREMLEITDTVTPGDILKYMRSLYYAVNTVAELSGPPLQERRLLLDFPARAEAAQRSGMVEGLYGLLGANTLDAAALNAWLAGWRSAFEAAMENSRVDVSIHPTRLNYYEKAFQAILAGDTPRAVVWPILQTWSLAAEVLSEDALETWRAACGQLGLTAIGIDKRVEGLDHFLDEVEGLLDELATHYGLDTLTGLEIR